MKTANDAIDEFAEYLERMSLETDGRLIFDILRVAAERQASALIAVEVITLADAQTAFANSAAAIAEQPAERTPTLIYSVGNDTVN